MPEATTPPLIFSRERLSPAALSLTASPVKDGDIPGLKRSSNQVVIGGGHMNHEQATKILVVDDEPFVCGLLSRWLTAEGYSCDVASNGEAAIELPNGERHHLVVSLVLAKKIIEDHNGSISVKSNEEVTMFTVWLPIRHTPAY